MKNIVLAYDGSDAAKRALERTADLANGAAVKVVSAVRVMPPVVRAGPLTDPEEVVEREHELADAAEYLRSRGVIPETIEAHAADIGEAIVDEAKNVQADLIIVGSGRKNLAERVFLGSVSTRVVHEAPCDVLVVR